VLDFENWEFSLSIATNRDLAEGLVDGYVSVITLVRMSGVRRLRMDEIERRALSVNRASNKVTARSSNGKLLLMSIPKKGMSVDVSGTNRG
jgi:hypothetical protein